MPWPEPLAAGLDVHDVGNYDTDRSRVLEPGMVLTVEPGLYIATDADGAGAVSRHRHPY